MTGEELEAFKKTLGVGMDGLLAIAGDLGRLGPAFEELVPIREGEDRSHYVKRLLDTLVVMACTLYLNTGAGEAGPIDFVQYVHRAVTAFWVAQFGEDGVISISNEISAIADKPGARIIMGPEPTEDREALGHALCEVIEERQKKAGTTAPGGEA